MKLILAIILAAIPGCSKPDDKTYESGGWTRVGEVGDAFNGPTSIWKIKDKDTGDTVYATTRGGVFVLRSDNK